MPEGYRVLTAQYRVLTAQERDRVAVSAYGPVLLRWQDLPGLLHNGLKDISQVSC